MKIIDLDLDKQDELIIDYQIKNKKHKIIKNSRAKWKRNNDLIYGHKK